MAVATCIFRRALDPTPAHKCWCGVFTDEAGAPAHMCIGEETCIAKHVQEDHYQIPHIAYPNAKDWDATIPVPYHCLIRLINTASASGLVGPGTALERDILMTEQAIKDECERTKNVQ